MSDLSTARSGDLRPVAPRESLSEVRPPSEDVRAPASSKTSLSDRRVYNENNNATPRAGKEADYARSLLQNSQASVESMYGRTARDLPSGDPRRFMRLGDVGGTNTLSTAGRAKVSNLTSVLSHRHNTMNSVEVLDRRANIANLTGALKGDYRSQLLNERKACRANSGKARFSGLKRLARSINGKLSSMFARVRNDSGKSVSRFHTLPMSLRNVVARHEQVQETRHANMRAQLQNRGKFDLRTRKFAELFAARTEHFDKISSKFSKNAQDIYKEMKGQTQAMLKDSEGRVFTTDEKYHEMVKQVERMNALFLQDIDMELFELKLERK